VHVLLVGVGAGPIPPLVDCYPRPVQQSTRSPVLRASAASLVTGASSRSVRHQSLQRRLIRDQREPLSLQVWSKS